MSGTGLALETEKSVRPGLGSEAAPRGKLRAAPSSVPSCNHIKTGARPVPGPEGSAWAHRGNTFPTGEQVGCREVFQFCDLNI